MIDYEKMSDDLLNIKVKNVLFGRDWVNESALRKWHFNDPSRAWSVIECNGIGIEKTADNKKWIARKFMGLNPLDKVIVVVNPNALRAAIIVFLMIQEEV